MSVSSQLKARRMPVPQTTKEMGLMIWTCLLAYITGTVDQELLLRNEYLAAENRILRAKIKGRLLPTDSEKSTLGEIGHRLGRKALADGAAAAKRDTLSRWYRELIARKFDGSRFRKSVGRPPIDEKVERLVVRMARENPSWGYDRIVGAMANLGHKVSDQTVGNILRRHDIPPALIWSELSTSARSWCRFCRCGCFCCFSRTGPAAAGAGLSDD